MVAEAASLDEGEDILSIPATRSERTAEEAPLLEVTVHAAKLEALDPYQFAYAELKRLRDKGHSRIKQLVEPNGLIDQLLTQISRLKSENKVPVGDLIKALNSTYLRLTGRMKHPEYHHIANDMQGKPLPGLKILGGIMIALGIAIAALGIVFFPLGAGVAAATASATIAFGIGFFAAGFCQTGVSKAMDKVDAAIGNKIEPAIQCEGYLRCSQ